MYETNIFYTIIYKYRKKIERPFAFNYKQIFGKNFFNQGNTDES